jgi:hypothetical protein
MVRVFITLLLAASCICGRAGELDQPYQPTRAEWLKVAISEAVRESIGSWGLRVNVTVAVFKDVGEVAIVVTEANGQRSPNERVKAGYVKTVRLAAQSVMQRYEWSRNLKLSVEFV